MNMVFGNLLGALLRGMIRNWILLSLIVGAGLAASPARAGPVFNYGFALTIDSVDRPCAPSSSLPTFGCPVVGDQWLGIFQIALDASSHSDGPISTPFLSMHLDTGPSYWDHCRLIGTCATGDPANLLQGYRDVVGSQYFNSDGPGFYIESGRIVGFSAGWFGSGDLTFFDFDYLFAPGAGLFAARALDGMYVRGTYAIAQIPEPTTLALTILALAMVIGLRDRSLLPRLNRPPHLPRRGSP